MDIQVAPGDQGHIPPGLGLGALHGQVLPGGQSHVHTRRQFVGHGGGAVAFAALPRGVHTQSQTG